LVKILKECVFLAKKQKPVLSIGENGFIIA